MISFACPKCGMAYSEPDGSAGRKFFCTNVNCGQKIQVPLPPAQRTVGGIPFDNPQSLPAKRGEWHYEYEGGSRGPVSMKDLKHLARTGRLVPSARVWTPGMIDWQTAEKALPGLFAALKKEKNENGETTGGDRSATRWEAIGFACFALVCAGILTALAVVLIPKLSSKNEEPAKKEEPKPAIVEIEKPTDLSWKEVTKKTEKSVALLKHRFGTGSGFLIQTGILVTNAHVTNKDLIERLEITFPSSGNNRKYKAELLYEDRKRDLAILKLDASLSPLPLATNDPEKAEKLAAIGSPGTSAEGGTSPNAFSSGELSNTITLVDDGQEYYQMTVPINGGNSGGPVLNARGQVVGVATAYEIDKQSVNYAIPLRELRKAVDKAVAMKDKDLDLVTAEHDYITLFNRLRIAFESKLNYVECTRDVLRGAANRANELPRLERLMKESTGRILAIAGDAPRITAHRSLPEDRKRRLRDFINQFDEMNSELTRLLDQKASPQDLDAASLLHAARLQVMMEWFVLTWGKDNLRM